MRFPWVISSPHILCQAWSDSQSCLWLICVYSQSYWKVGRLRLLSTIETEGFNTDWNVSHCSSHLLVKNLLYFGIAKPGWRKLHVAIFPGCREKASLYVVGGDEGNRGKNNQQMERESWGHRLGLFIQPWWKLVSSLLLPVIWSNIFPFLLKLVQLGFCHWQPKHPNTSNYFSPVQNPKWSLIGHWFNTFWNIQRIEYYWANKSGQ